MRARFILALIFFASLSVNAQVISQVYGGGGNAGATYTNDFIEIFNNTQSPINLSGYSVQYTSAAGTTWQVTVLGNFTLQPGQYYLIQEASNAAVGNSLPSPDITTGTINLSAASGKVALVNSINPLSGSCPAVGTYIDLVGYGSTASCFETAPVSPTPTNNTSSVLRSSGGCIDVNNNSTDFSVGPVNPRNSTTVKNPCSPLPVKLANVIALKSAAGLNIRFTNLTESDVIQYDIERSANGIQFTSISQLKPLRNDGSQVDYSFTDNQPAAGVNFYRIKATEVNGKTAFSVVVKINAAAMQTGLTIYPNPVKGGQLNLQVSNVVPGLYQLFIRSATGQVVYQQNLNTTSNTFSQSLSLRALKAGMYSLEIKGASTMTKQFIIE